MPTIHDKLGLARYFGELLQTEIVPADFAELTKRNAMHDPFSPVCLSHDYCDANVIMANAWEQMFGGPFPLAGDDGRNGPTDTDMDIWDEAWAIARAANFFRP